MSNLIIAVHQATLDYNYRVGRNLGKIAAHIVEEGWLKEASELFEGVQAQGLSKDTKLTVTEYDKMPSELNKLREWLNKERYDYNIQIGGDPAITAIRGGLLNVPKHGDLPVVWYAGVYPNSVKEALEKGKVEEAEEIRKVFRILYRNDKEPQSVGLESDVFKLIIVYGPGRSINGLASKGSFEGFLTSVVDEIKKEFPNENDHPKHITIAINTAHSEWMTVEDEEEKEALESVANKLVDEYKKVIPAGDKESENFKKSLINDEGKVSEIVYLKRLIEQAKTEIKQALPNSEFRIFAATRYLRDERGDLLTYLAQGVFLLLRQVDIISTNETELQDLHTVYKGAFHDIPLAYKLRELPFKAIKVCHSADGVIMDLGCRPEHIITSQRFREDPAGFLEEVLKLSADGATYAMDATAELGRWANEAMVRIYSQEVKDENRRHAHFNRTFLNVDAPMPAGMISIPSAQVVHPLGAVVGLGAVFDGLFLSFLMRD
jgi:hypothetical protein